MYAISNVGLRGNIMERKLSLLFVMLFFCSRHDIRAGKAWLVGEVLASPSRGDEYTGFSEPGQRSTAIPDIWR